MKVAAPTIITLAALVLVVDGAVGDDCADNARQRLHQPAAGRSPELDCGRQRERALRRVHLAGDRPRPRRHKRPPRRVRDRPQERTHAAREREQQRRAGEGRPESGRRLGRARDQRKRPLRARSRSVTPRTSSPATPTARSDAFVRDRRNRQDRGAFRRPSVGVYAGALSANGRYAVLQADENVYGCDLTHGGTCSL